MAKQNLSIQKIKKITNKNIFGCDNQWRKKMFNKLDFKVKIAAKF